jgi:hypothetical protein
VSGCRSVHNLVVCLLFLGACLPVPQICFADFEYIIHVSLNQCVTDPVYYKHPHGPYSIQPQMFRGMFQAIGLVPVHDPPQPGCLSGSVACLISGHAAIPPRVGIAGPSYMEFVPPLQSFCITGQDPYEDEGPCIGDTSPVDIVVVVSLLSLETPLKSV